MHPNKIIDDIISLKIKHNLLEDNWTAQKQVDWLRWAIPMGLVVIVYKEGKLVGYMEYVRLDQVPTDIHHVKLDYDRVRTAPIAFITNCISEERGIVVTMKKIATEANPDVEEVVWHNKRTDRWFRKRRVIHEK